MLLDADSQIPQNSLQGVPLDEQLFSDYDAGRVLVSGIEAATVARCAAPASAMAPYGPVMETEAVTALSLAAVGQSAAATLEQAVSAAAGAGATISDQDVQNGPNVTPLGSQGAVPVFTEAQILAASSQPRNNANDMIFRPHQPRRAARDRVGQLIGPGGEQLVWASHGRGGQPGQRFTQNGARFPGAPWGQFSNGSKCGGMDQFPWGKLMLFGGLGLIALGALNSHTRGRR